MTGFVPVDLADKVQVRIRDRVPELARDTAGAVDFAALVAAGQLPQRLPAAFVIVGGLIADGERRAGGTSSTVTQTIAVVLVQGDHRDTTGEAARAAVWPLEWAVIRELAGWSPAPGYSEFLLAEDRLQGMGAAGRTGVVACTISFTTEWKFHTRTGGV